MPSRLNACRPHRLKAPCGQGRAPLSLVPAVVVTAPGTANVLKECLLNKWPRLCQEYLTPCCKEQRAQTGIATT